MTVSEGVERRTQLLRLATVAAVTTAAAVLAVAVGSLAVRSPVLGLAAAVAVLTVGLSMAEPAILPVLAMPLILVVPRVGATSWDLSLSDAVLFFATWPAVFLGGRPYSVAMRRVLWAVAGYEAVMLLSVVWHPFQANMVEWGHQLFLLAGSLVVGWCVGRRGLARVGFGLLVAMAAVLAGSALVQAALQYARGDLGPVYLMWPWPMHKNAVGTTLGMVTAALYARPAWLRWPRRVTSPLVALLAAAVLVSQSRQAVVALLLVAFVVARRDGRLRSVGWLAALAVLGLGLVGTYLHDQLQSQNIHNSAFQRLTWLSDSFGVWQLSPWFGLGNRWWYTGAYDVAFQPPQVFVEVLTTTGVVGLVAFVALMAVLLTTLWRLPVGYGLFGFAAVASRLVQGQFDIFWLAIQSSLPFLLAGLTLGALEFDRPSHRAPDLDRRRAARSAREVSAG